MEKGDIVVNNVSIKFNLNPEKIDNLKEYVIKKLKGEISYQEFWALKDVSFELKKGERLGILGLNGSGKSTLLKTIAGVYKPTTGTVRKSGLLMPMLELGAGFDMQYTGRENVFLYGSVLGFKRDFMREHYREIVDFSELNEFMNVPLKNYSSGMRARLGFSIATVLKPDILILDEVLSVGDAKFKKKSENKMMELIEGGTTVLFVSHSLSQVQRICNKAMILDHGKMISFGDIDEVSKEYEKIIE
ncbi:MAG: ABC transporter ATP-binding protein [Lachnospiraceae bacterium]|nr:ABC transporter ATP-binding protein [Lachnospiraceae bacterium]